MNKIQDPQKLLSAISIIPDSAPFTTEQKAWLNGFFAGMTGMEEIHGAASGQAGNQLAVETEEEEDFPWKDESLEIEERLKLASDRPHKRQLMAAMAQLDCGSCGYLCQTYSEAIASGEETNLTLCSPGGKETSRAIKKLIKINAESGSAPSDQNGAAAQTKNDKTTGWSRKNPFPAKLINNKQLTGAGSAKDVRHVEIDLSGSELTYNVGDSLGVYPSNCSDLISDILLACEVSEGNSPAELNTKDLTAATEELVEWFTENLLDEKEKALAQRIAGDDDLLDEHDVLDLLRGFKTLKIPFTDLLQCLPELNPRLYSIASSLKKHPDQVHLTVGKVNYEKNGRVRKGVASTMLAERVEAGGEVSVFIQPSHGFTVPTDSNAPIIMVGPGTGIAPFVSFLQEREATESKGDNWLFFGDQKSETDFLYKDMLEDYATRGILKRLDTAFSRDQDHKIYVQDRMRESGAEIFKWLESGGYFYVCGDASRMAKDVDTALHEIVAQHGNMSADQATAYIKKLASDNRYERDVY